MKITLVDRNLKDVKELEVDQDKVVEASVILHEGRYYVYSGATGRFFSMARFTEINPPVEVP